MAVTEGGKKYARKIANDETPEQAMAVFKDVMGVLLGKTSAECDVYVFTSYQVLREWIVMCDFLFGSHNFDRRAVLVWEKDGPGMGDLNNPWGMGCEFIFYYGKGRREKNTKRRNNVLHVPQVRPSDLIHPHEKPQSLLEMLIKASTDEHDFIVDPFGGSGSLAMAARNTNRSAVCIELDQENYDLAQARFNSAEDSLI